MFNAALRNHRRFGRAKKIKFTPNGNSSRALIPSKLLTNFTRFLPNQTSSLKHNLSFTLRQFSTTKAAPSINLEFPILNPKKPMPAIAENLDDIPHVAPISHAKFGAGSSKSGIPSVTTILKATMPAEDVFVLEQWKASMIKKLGPQGFTNYQRETFDRGSKLHAVVADFLLGKGEPLREDHRMANKVVSNLWKSIKDVVINKISNPRLIEHIVTHKEMKYRGIVDCVAFYEGQLTVIDFKTAEKKKKSVSSLYDNPLQVSAYCGALNNDATISEKHLDSNIASAVLVVAYCDGSEADVHHFDQNLISEKYWKLWVERLNQYSTMPVKTT